MRLNKTFRLVYLDFDTAYRATQDKCVDFVFSNPSMHLCLELQYQVNVSHQHLTSWRPAGARGCAARDAGPGADAAGNFRAPMVVQICCTSSVTRPLVCYRSLLWQPC